MVNGAQRLDCRRRALPLPRSRHTIADDTYGKEKVQAILLSSKPTFGAAVREALGDDLSGFAAKFAKWQAQAQ